MDIIFKKKFLHKIILLNYFSWFDPNLQIKSLKIGRSTQQTFGNKKYSPAPSWKLKKIIYEIKICLIGWLALNLFCFYL
jgi:hypothetical protein